MIRCLRNQSLGLAGHLIVRSPGKAPMLKGLVAADVVANANATVAAAVVAIESAAAVVACDVRRRTLIDSETGDTRVAR